MVDRQSQVHFRVRYSETDQMGISFSAAALEWFSHAMAGAGEGGQ